MTQIRERPARILDRDELPQPAAGDVLEEDPLERLERTEIEHLLLRGDDESHDTVFL